MAAHPDRKLLSGFLASVVLILGGWPVAGAAARQAEPPDQADQARRTAGLMVDLEAARLRPAALKLGGAEVEAKIAAYLRAFQAYGVDVVGMPVEEVARRLRGSGQAEDVAAALAEWAPFHLGLADGRRLIEMADALDPDPTRVELRAALVARDLGTLRKMAGEPDVARQSPTTLVLLGSALDRIGDKEAALRLLERAQRAHPGDFWINHQMGLIYFGAGPVGYGRAVGHWRAAVALHPKSPFALFNLALALHLSGDLDAAIETYRLVAELDPRLDEAHNNMGAALQMKGHAFAAIAAHRKAIAINPDRAETHANLAGALRMKGDNEGAIASYRRAAELDPNLATTHSDLGLTFYQVGRIDSALAACRRAVELDPANADAQIRLGAVLVVKEDTKGAIEAFRAAAQSRPDSMEAFFNLGVMLVADGDNEGAVTVFRKAVALNGDFAEGYYHLGITLLKVGRFASALEALERSHERGARQPGWRYPSAQAVNEARRFIQLEGRLPAVLRDEEAPRGDTERVTFAEMANHKGFPVAAVRLWREAFAASPSLAGPIGPQYRYRAAIAASRAGRGLGKDEPTPDRAARAEFRRQARDWLQADLADWSRMQPGPSPQLRQALDQSLRTWRADPDLATLRDEQALASLPEAERAECRDFWKAVEMLRWDAAFPADPFAAGP